MANDFLSVNKGNPLGSRLVNLAEAVRSVRDETDLLNDAASHLHDGATYTSLEGAFGLPSGTGSNFVTFLGNLQNILNTNTTVAGTDRLSQLDEFVARLAGQ